MGYVEENLAPGEVVLHLGRLHPIALFWHIVIAAIIGLPALVMVGSGHAIAIPVVLIAAASLIAGILRFRATEIGVTNRRVIAKSGLMSRHTLELLLQKVESVTIDQGPLAKLLGYGTVVVRGTGGTSEAFEPVAQPLELRRHVHEQIERAQAVMSRAEVPGASAMTGGGFCTQCGARQTSDWKFCAACGAARSAPSR